MLNYPVTYSLFEREKVVINMQGTVINLARLKIVPTIKNLICRCLLYDCEMCAVENYMFLKDSQLV